MGNGPLVPLSPFRLRCAESAQGAGMPGPRFFRLPDLLLWVYHTGLSWPLEQEPWNPCCVQNIQERAGRIPGPPPFMARKSDCCEPGIFQLTQEFSVGRKADQVISPSLGSWQGQREGVTSLDGMTDYVQNMAPLFFQLFLGWGDGREGEKEGPSMLHCVPQMDFSSRLAVEASRDCGEGVPHALSVI